MTRIFRLGVVITALTALVLLACESGAQAVGVKVSAAPVRIKAPVIKDPPPVQMGTAVQNPQHSSDFGVQINIRHKRDRLQRKSKPGEPKTN